MESEQPDFQVPNKYDFEPAVPLPLTALTALNSLKHGGTSRTLFINGEQPQDFYLSLAATFEKHMPSDSEDADLVTDLVLARWYLRRRERAYNKRESELYNQSAQENSPTLETLKELQVYERYRIQAERTYKRAKEALKQMKEDPLREEKWRAQLALQQSRFTIERERFELRKSQAVLKDNQAKRQLADLTLTEKKIAEAELKSAIVPTEKGITVIKQVVCVTATGIDFTPSNQVVADIIRNRHLCVVPPQQVAREFYFLTGIVPPQYEWTISDLDPEFRATLDDPTQGVRCYLKFETWQSMADQEISAPTSA